MATKKANSIKEKSPDLSVDVQYLKTQILELQKIATTQTEELERQAVKIRDLTHIPIQQENPSDRNRWFENANETTASWNSMNATKIPMLHKAEELINGARQQDYGDKLQNFSQIAMLWQGILATKLQNTQFITAEDVALCMMAVKMARLAKSPDHSDSILDIAGYAGCYDKLQQERKANVQLQGAIFDPRNGTS